MRIDVPLARCLVADQFPEWAGLPIEPVEPGGWDNRTFRLGDSLSLRFPSAEAYAPQIEKERLWLPRLAPELPLPIPTPIAHGTPAHGYPWPWSVRRWIDGAPASVESVAHFAGLADPSGLATELAGFLLALQRIDSHGGPEPGAHNFHRGGLLSVYDAETRAAISDLRGSIDSESATAIWTAALASDGPGPPVWLHGDVSPGNLLVDSGRLKAVIDFGGLAVGDPACDLAIHWTFFSGASRTDFRRALGADDACWARARGWALWKGLITLAGYIECNPSDVRRARGVVNEVLDHP